MNRRKMKTLLLLILLFTENACTDSQTVYLCDSAGGKKYHYNEHCRGLSNCQHRIIKVTLEEAKKRGKTLCGWEKNK
jgi:5-bromo-4-chloroindolyl phosphate hydrolysis protein